MAINLLHYSTGNDNPTWGVVRGNTVLPLPGRYATTADVLHQGADCQATSLNLQPDDRVSVKRHASTSPFQPSNVARGTRDITAHGQARREDVAPLRATTRVPQPYRLSCVQKP
jgi:hypothetical protein